MRATAEEDFEEFQRNVEAEFKDVGKPIIFVEAEPKTDQWPVMADAAFHGPAGRAVKMIEPHTEADPNAILLQYLTVFGNAAGNTAYYPVEGDKHTTNLFVAMVGKSSKARKGRRSAASNRLPTSPIRLGSTNAPRAASPLARD